MDKHIEDIKNIREELNWRVKISYTSTTIFYAVIIFALNIFLQNDKKFEVKENVNLFVFVCSTISMLMILFAVTLIANHLTEKKIELYILQIQKKILKKSSDERIEIPRFSWISFLYADEYRCYLEARKFHQYLHNFALYIHPIFQFVLPILISLFILLLVFFFVINTYYCKVHIIALVYYIVICLMGLSSVPLAIAFLIFFKKLKKEHRSFFYTHIHPYFTNEYI